ncbi:class I SAM-dependent methyltransferase [Nisaea sediminum]|uniref:class I SAM-dependent methyltransferase n=1 Tax=Nisaea sediminum TaxID=2775867 RepID=UPI0018695865|nr:class I SAM-dependent methyltransferase [Nisaea sediminum]
MSRLDSAIRRLQAQKLSLEWAVSAIAGRSGNAIELGLGNGRTFDHLRSLMPDRAFYVFDRQVAAHPDCIPADDRIFLGDFRETLVRARAQLGPTVLLAHLDIGTGEKQTSIALAAEIAPLVDALLADGAVVVSDQPVELPRWNAAPLPDGISPGRIHLYRIAAT